MTVIPVCVCACVCVRSARSPPAEGGSGGIEFNSHQGGLALPAPQSPARAGPRLPGALRTGGEWRRQRTAPHQGCHAGRCTGEDRGEGCKTGAVGFRLIRVKEIGVKGIEGALAWGSEGL